MQARKPRCHDNQQNMGSPYQPDSPTPCLSAKKTSLRCDRQQRNSSTLKPIKLVVNDQCAGLRSRLSFQKKQNENQLVDSGYPMRQSRPMQYGISGLDLTAIAGQSQSRLSQDQPPNVGEILRKAERFVSHVNSSSENEHSLFRVRAMHRLVDLLTRIMEAPGNNDELMMLGGIGHQDSLNLLIDRYEYVLSEQDREIEVLRQRLRNKEEELLECERKAMALLECSRADFYAAGRAPLEMSGLSSLASPHPTRNNLSLEGVSAVRSHRHNDTVRRCGSPVNLRTQPFIKVQDEDQDRNKSSERFVVALPNEDACLFEQEARTPTDRSIIQAEGNTARFYQQSSQHTEEAELPQEQTKEEQRVKLSFEEPGPNVSLGSNTAEEERVNCSAQLPRTHKQMGLLLEVACQTQYQLSTTVKSDACVQSEELLPQLSELQEEAAPIFEQADYVISAMVTVQNSRNVAHSVQPPLSERVWVRHDANCHQASSVSAAALKCENVMSMSLSHTTLERNPHCKLRPLKGLVKCLSEVVSACWKLILHARQKAKLASLSRTTLKLTKDNIETFERWFNDRYDGLRVGVTKEDLELFGEGTLKKVQEFSTQLTSMIDTLCGDAGKQ